MDLFRGFGKYFPDGEYQNPFLDTPRSPIDTGIEVHKIADIWFENKFGIAARSSTILCSTSREQAEEYYHPGHSIALIKPIGEYKIIYSPYVTDFTEYLASFGNNATSEEVNAWLDKKQYRCLQGSQDICPSFKGELMLYCKKYKLVNLDTHL